MEKLILENQIVIMESLLDNPNLSNEKLQKLRTQISQTRNLLRIIV